MMGKSFLISVRRTDTGRRKGDEGGTINSPLTLERTTGGLPVKVFDAWWGRKTDSRKLLEQFCRRGRSLPTHALLIVRVVVWQEDYCRRSSWWLLTHFSTMSTTTPPEGEARGEAVIGCSLGRFCERHDQAQTPMTIHW